MENSSIDKEQIERYFGTVESYIEWLDIRIGNLLKQRDHLFLTELHSIFAMPVREMAINNTGFQNALCDCKENLLSVLDSQINIFRSQRLQAKNLI